MSTLKTKSLCQYHFGGHSCHQTGDVTKNCCKWLHWWIFLVLSLNVKMTKCTPCFFPSTWHLEMSFGPTKQSKSVEFTAINQEKWIKDGRGWGRDKRNILLLVRHPIFWAIHRTSFILSRSGDFVSEKPLTPRLSRVLHSVHSLKQRSIWCYLCIYWVCEELPMLSLIIASTSLLNRKSFRLHLSASDVQYWGSCFSSIFSIFMNQWIIQVPHY